MTPTTLRAVRQRLHGQLVYLIYLANMAWQPWFDPTASWVDWALVAGIAVAFIPLFVASHHPRRRVAMAALVGTVVLGTVATLFNVGASVLFVYAAAMAAEFSRDQALRWNVGMTFLLFGLATVSPVPFPYRLWGVLPSLVFLWIVGLQVQRDVARRTEAERLRIDNVRIEQLATSAERERIARDLHDLLGQSLTGIVVRAQLIQSLAGQDPAAAAQEAQSVEEGARAALEQVRSAISGLRDVSLDDEIAAARRTLVAAGVNPSVQRQDAVEPNPLVERSLALALREAVTNVIRHSEASACIIELGCADGIWRLAVRDNGNGDDAPEGNGLRGMRERITAVGGRVERRVNAGSTGGTGSTGTSVIVTVPA